MITEKEIQEVIEYLKSEYAFEEDAEFIGGILGKHGVDLRRFDSLSKFYDYVNTVEKVPELLLLDIEVEGISGFDVIDKLEEIGGDIARVPIILLAEADSDGAEVKGLKRSQVMDFIKKPYEKEILKARVNHILELAALRKKYRVLV